MSTPRAITVKQPAYRVLGTGSMTDDTRPKLPAGPPPDIDADHALERFPPGAEPIPPEEERPLSDDTRGAGDQEMRDTDGRRAIRHGKSGQAREDRQ
jgi:hypothetical protein